MFIIIIFYHFSALFGNFKNSEARADSSPDPSSARTKCKKQISLGFAKIHIPRKKFSQNRVRIEAPPPRPNTWRAEPKKKNVLSILEKIHPHENQKARNIFSFWGCRVKRGGGGAFGEGTISFRVTTSSARAIHYRF